MRILIISDTHHRDDNYLKLIERVKPVDLLIHCGDTEGSEVLIAQTSGCPVEMVAGNNDFFCALPREKEFMIGSYKVWLTHGHNYNVSMGNEMLKEEARVKGADIVMYGHTHKPIVDRSSDVIALNPGSLSYPRQEGRQPTYILMEIDAKGQAHFTINRY